jgi:glycogen debranching enzyme
MAVVFVRPDVVCAWRGPSLLVTTPDGECSGAQSISGFYYRETRFLGRLVLRVNGARPWLCEASALTPDALTFAYVHPEIRQPGGGGTGQSGDDQHPDAVGLPERSLEFRVTYSVTLSRLNVAIEVINRALDEVSADLECAVDADFADIQEALSGHREQQAEVECEPSAKVLRFRYTHPELQYRTEIQHGAEWEWRGDSLYRQIRLRPRQATIQTISVVPIDLVDRWTAADVASRDAALETWRQSFSRVKAVRNRTFEDVVSRNVRDFASFPLMSGPRDEWLCPQAGVPLYPAFFGRDALTAGWQAASVDRGQALDAALVRLGRLQTDRFDAWRDEEPGRIPYQVRTGPLARLNLNPYSAYYADYASPLMYVISLANLFAWTGETSNVRRHWDTVRRILDWAREHGDSDRDGYLEYHTHSSKGTKNQGWKDSGDAIIYDDGAPVPSPIATCELQGYWYAAQELMALLSMVMNVSADAAAWRDSAARLKQAFNRDWWLADERFFALALDPDKRAVGAPGSNVGHCLACGIIDRERLEPVVGRMFEPDLFSGWGIRTLTSKHAYYNPLSYHRGSVWADEQATMVFGLRRFGFDTRALDLSKALFDLAQLYPEYRIPECVGGYPRGERDTPGAYPRANTPQLWNATAFPLVVQSILGLLPLAPVQTLLLDPVLPTWLPEIELRDLRVGDARVSLRFARDASGRTQWDVVHKSGTLNVVRQPAPESVSAGPLDRLRAVFETVVS